MISDIAIIVFLQAAVLVGAEGARKARVHEHYTRKGAHIAAGLIAAMLPIFVGRDAAIFCGVVGTVLMGALVWYGVVRSLGERGTFDVGVICFPLGLTLCAYFFWWDDSHAIYQYAALMLAIPDAVAGIAGRIFGKKPYFMGKTAAGSGAFYLSACVVTFGFMVGAGAPIALAIKAALVGSLLLTIVEAVSVRGTDNLSVPVAAGFLALLLF